MSGRTRAPILAFFLLAAPMAHALLEPPPPSGLQADLLRAGMPAEFLPLVALVPSAPPLPAEPVQALTEEVAYFLAELGFAYDPAAEVEAAGLDHVLAGRTAQALAALRTCHDASRAALESAHAAGATQELLDGRREAPASGIRGCAVAAAQALTNLETAAQMPSAPAFSAPLLDIWPVLAIGGAGDDAYSNDYVLLVDLGGNDLYDNNAGGNLVDVRFAPASSPFPGIDPIPHVAGVNDGDDDRSGYGPSEGCAIAARSIQAGNCTVTASGLVDVGGHDVYGVFKAPVARIDGRCTADPVIRRMVTNGAAAIGFGMLLDSVGNDRYNGRQASTGTGHVSGIGILTDRAGDDRYLDAMLAQGFSLVGYLGLLVDEGGDDRYEHYRPAPLVPGTPDEHDGAGGLIDDTGVCDGVTRSLQGAGFLVGVGVLLDLGGQDLYSGACPRTYNATAAGKPLGAPACGQGFGGRGGLGILLDHGGDPDTYLGVPGRSDQTILLGADVLATADGNDPRQKGTDLETSIDAFLDT